MDCFIFIFLLSIIPYYTRATICYECLDGASNCTLIETTDTGYLGCLIEFDNEDGNELKVAKVGKFCPDSYPECQSLIIDKHYWLTFIWEMHNPNLLARKIPIKKMWYECLEDKCNNPEYISNLKSVLVEWESSIIDLPSRSAGPQKNCFDCEKQNVSHDCEVSVSCNSTNELCKTQGYLVDTNPFATRLFLHYNVRFWQSKCETLAENTNLIDYSITGYLINNLNTKKRNIAIEAFCKYDDCNTQNKISELANNVKVSFKDEPWFNNSKMVQSSWNFLIFSILFIYMSNFF